MTYIPSKTDAINADWQSAYDHFRDRLKERYGIDIAFHEYVKLTRVSLQVVSSPNKNTRIGILEIKGKKVLVCKERYRDRHLKTALPLHVLHKYQLNGKETQQSKEGK